MKKQLLTTIVVLLATAFVFTSCGGNESTNPATTTASSPLDGVWFSFDTYAATESQPEITFIDTKIVINGTSGSFYEVDDFFVENMTIHENLLLADAATQATYGYSSTSAEPLPFFYPFVNTFNIVTDGNDVLFVQGNSSQSAVLSEDGATLTVYDNHGNSSEYTKLEGYTPGPLEDTWFTMEYNETVESYEYFGRLVFFGNKYQMYTVTDDYLDAFDAWVADPSSAEFVEDEYSYPYVLTGTYSVNGSAISLTNESTSLGQPENLTWTYDAASGIITAEVAGGELEFLSQTALMAQLGPELFNTNGSFNGTWYGTVSEAGENDYTGFPIYKFIIDSETGELFVASETYLEQISAYNEGTRSEEPVEEWVALDVGYFMYSDEGELDFEGSDVFYSIDLDEVTETFSIYFSSYDQDVVFTLFATE